MKMKERAFQNNPLVCSPYTLNIMHRDSAVSTATHYGLDGPGIKSRWGRHFLNPVQAGLGAYPASYKIGTALSRGVKPLRRGVDHLPPI
jgi:hypothetical protein